MRLRGSMFAKLIGAITLAMLVVSGGSYAFADPGTTVTTPSGPTGGQLINVSRNDTGSAIQTPLDPNTQAFKDELAKKQARLTELEPPGPNTSSRRCPRCHRHGRGRS